MSHTPPSDPPLADEDFPEPPRLRALRLAVMGLTIAAAVAVLAVAAALVIRAARPAAPMAVLPAAALPFDPRAVAAETLTLPADEVVQTLGAAPGALLVLTRDGAGAERLRLIDAETGDTIRVIAVTRP
jgi:hypothetical protein